MIKTVEVENEKVKVYNLYATCALDIYDLLLIVFSVANLGYCRSGKISFHYSKLLQISTCIDISL